MGALESLVMDVLWSEDRSWTPSEVQTALDRQHEVAYTTVMTILVRLAEKGRVVRARRGRGYAYRPTQTRAEYVAAQMHAALPVNDRAGALAAFVQGLSRRDREQLRRLLGSRRAGGAR
jgi:predicted transcriptional regulator